MIGNDIVDLQLAKIQSNWRRPKFLEKIFTQKEQKLINHSANPELEVWKLWTMKESAYKIYNRETGIRGFFPWKLECSIERNCEGRVLGKVSIKDKIYYSKTIVSEDFVYTIAGNSLENLDHIIEINSDQKVIKIEGLPFLESNMKPISVTHHGRFERRIRLGPSL